LRPQPATRGAALLPRARRLDVPAADGRGVRDPARRVRHGGEARPPRSVSQLELFARAARPTVRGVVGPAAAPPHVEGRGRRLPANLFVGTSSWSFPGWRGLVWAREVRPATLARHGLPAYAAHPCLRSVGLDRTYYAPLAPERFAALAAQVPAH